MVEAHTTAGAVRDYGTMRAFSNLRLKECKQPMGLAYFAAVGAQRNFFSELKRRNVYEVAANFGRLCDRI